MGAYLRKPVTEKTSDSGEYTYCGRKIIYASTAMQGWRVAMEDAHSVVPEFDKDSSMFAVYDGHGGKSVAIYCAEKMGEMIKSMDAYKAGEIEQAMKDAFLNCDEKLLLPEVVKELKKIAESDLPDDSDEDIDTLIDEAKMPIHSLMAQYGGAYMDGDGEQNCDGSDEALKVNRPGEGGVKNILQILCSNAGIDIEFEDSGGDSSDSDVEESDPSVELDESDVTPDKDVNSTLPKSTLEQSPTRTSTLDTNSSSPSNSVQSNSNSTLTALLKTKLDKPETEHSVTMELEKERQTLLSCPSSSNTDATTTSQSDQSHSLNLPSRSSDCSSSNETKILSSETRSEVKDDQSDKTNQVSTLKDLSKDSIQTSSPVKSRGLKDLLTAGVEDRYNADGMPKSMEATNNEEMNEQSSSSFLRGSRKRPHPEDDIDRDQVLFTRSSAHKRRETIEEGSESGTTAVVCLLRENDVYVANAGDSRCVMSSNGKAIELSFDHKPTDPIELARIERAGGKVSQDGRVNRGLNLSRAIGDHFYKTTKSLPLKDQMISPLPDIERAVLDKDTEFIVLACDGIWNCKTSQQVVDYVRCRLLERTGNETSQQDLVDICEALCDSCLAVDTDNDGTGCDNMTCILVLLKSLDTVI